MSQLSFEQVFEIPIVLLQCKNVKNSQVGVAKIKVFPLQSLRLFYAQKLQKLEALPKVCFSHAGRCII